MESGVRWGRDQRHGRIPEWLLASDASDKAVRLYCTLAVYATAGAAKVTKKALMERLGCSAAALDRALKALEAVAALTVERRFGDNGSPLANVYVLHWAEDEKASCGRGGPLAEEGRGPLAEEGSRARERLSESLSRSALSLSSEDGDEKDVAVAVPKLVKVEGQNIAFNALANVCGIDPSGNRGSELATALNGSKRRGIPIGIRELVWRELTPDAQALYAASPGFETIVVHRINLQAKLYREVMGDAMLTPTALAKWWADLERTAEVQGRKKKFVSPADIMSMRFREEDE